MGTIISLLHFPLAVSTPGSFIHAPPPPFYLEDHGPDQQPVEIGKVKAWLVYVMNTPTYPHSWMK